MKDSEYVDDQIIYFKNLVSEMQLSSLEERTLVGVIRLELATAYRRGYNDCKKQHRIVPYHD